MNFIGSFYTGETVLFIAVTQHLRLVGLMVLELRHSDQKHCGTEMISIDTYASVIAACKTFKPQMAIRLRHLH